MKKTFIILGVAFGVLIVVGFIGAYLVQVKGSALDKESKAYVDEVTPIILSRLNKETLFQYASDDLKNSGSSEEIDRIFNRLGKLGQFKEYKGSSGQARILVSKGKRKQITGLYEAKAEFGSGTATIKITTIRKENGWQIAQFRINTEAQTNL